MFWLCILKYHIEEHFWDIFVLHDRIHHSYLLADVCNLTLYERHFFAVSLKTNLNITHASLVKIPLKVFKVM
jgi:hypothetical protein